MAEIKVVMFDLGGVLLHPIFSKINPFMAKKYSADPEKIFDARHKHWPAFMLGEISAIEFFRRILVDVGAEPVDIESIVKMSCDAIELDDAAFQIVKELKDKVKLAILSNNSKEWAYCAIERFKFKDYFDEIFLSCDLALRKPTDPIYECAIKKLDVKPEEILFIDNKKSNVDAAKGLAIQGIVFESPGQLREELKKLSLL